MKLIVPVAALAATLGMLLLSTAAQTLSYL